MVCGVTLDGSLLLWRLPSPPPPGLPAQQGLQLLFRSQPVLGKPDLLP